MYNSPRITAIVLTIGTVTFEESSCIVYITKYSNKTFNACVNSNF